MAVGNDFPDIHTAHCLLSHIPTILNGSGPCIFLASRAYFSGMTCAKNYKHKTKK